MTLAARDIGPALRKAFDDVSDYVTRDELRAEVALLRGEIELTSQRLQTWMLRAVVAAILSAAGIGGTLIYKTGQMVSKIDTMAQEVSQLEPLLADRGVWMKRQDQRDSDQDTMLRQLAPAYQAMPYRETPK